MVLLLERKIPNTKSPADFEHSIPCSPPERARRAFTVLKALVLAMRLTASAIVALLGELSTRRPYLRASPSLPAHPACMPAGHHAGNH